MEKMTSSGVLYLVSTPIGNLKDITLRALEVLQEVDLIAAEDTRRSLILLKHYNISKPLTSYHDFNKEQKAPFIIKEILKDKKVAFISDAGTPGISDPGYLLVKLAIENQIQVIPIPGPIAAISALVVSGLPTDRFVFEGFLPKKTGKREKKLQELSAEKRTTIFYESAFRIQKTLLELKNFWGERKAVLARELTKKFEEIRRGTLSELSQTLKNTRLRGEIVLLVEGKGENEED